MSSFSRLENKNALVDQKRNFGVPRYRELKGHRKAVSCLTFTPEGILLSGSSDHSIRMWTNIERVAQASSISISRELVGHKKSVDQIRYNPKEYKTVASSSADSTVKLWDLRSGKETASIDVEGDIINVAWSPDGRHIITGNKDEVVAVIDVRTHKIVKEKKYRTEVNEMRWDRDGKFLFLSTREGNVEMFNWSVKGHPTYLEDQNASHVSTVHAHASDIVTLEFDSNGKYFATGSMDSTASIWSLPDLTFYQTVHAGEMRQVRGLSFSYDSELLGFTTENSVEIMHIKTGENVFRRSVDGISTLAFYPSKYWFAYASKNEDITLVIPGK